MTIEEQLSRLGCAGPEYTIAVEGSVGSRNVFLRCQETGDGYTVPRADAIALLGRLPDGAPIEECGGADENEPSVWDVIIDLSERGPTSTSKWLTSVGL